MAKLTVQDLIEQGYYNSLADISARSGASIKTVHYWKYKLNGFVTFSFIQDVADNARKALRITDIAMSEDARKKNNGGKRWEVVPEELITTELAPRVKNKALSSWILAHGVIGGYGA